VISTAAIIIIFINGLSTTVRRRVAATAKMEKLRAGFYRQPSSAASELPQLGTIDAATRRDRS
jgi:hypothetical protein